MNTADLADAHDSEMEFCNLPFLKIGLRTSFFGEIQTIKCFEDNGLVRSELGKPGRGRVLVVDGGGSTRVALIGDQLAELLIRNNWSGLIINGAVRDSAQIAKMDVGVFCLSVTPKQPNRHGKGVVSEPISFGNVTFRPAAFAYADSDGVLISACEKFLS